MKMFFICCISFLFLSHSVVSQGLIIKGRVRCLNQNQNSTKGAENIIVVPTFMPSKATLTASRPSGYFEVNTGITLSKLQDKMVTVYVISRCTNCKEVAKRVFISEDQDRQNRDDGKHYVTIKDWMLNANCQKAELYPLAADSVLQLIVKQPAVNLDNVSSATAIVGAPAFLNFLTNLTTVLGGAFPNGPFTIQTLQPGKIKYGQFLLSSPLFHSANTGFNFSPSRDMSEAVFWNPSAIANSKASANISLLTNVKNNGKLGGFYRINENFSLGGGIIFTMQDEFRKAIFNSSLGLGTAVDTPTMKLKEYAAFISPVFKISNNFNVALTLKSIWQDFNNPDSVFIDGSSGIPQSTFVDKQINKQHFDVDISATFKITSAFQVGVNLMNLAGTELYSDAFVRNQAYIPVQNQRSLGLGLMYKWQRLNVGTDLLFTKDKLYDASFGANFVPFNNALLSAGFTVKQLSYSFAFRIKHFRIAYINDNDWLVNQKRTGKSSILNGKIYGGFIFDLN